MFRVLFCSLFILISIVYTVPITRVRNDVERELMATPHSGKLSTPLLGKGGFENLLDMRVFSSTRTSDSVFTTPFYFSLLRSLPLFTVKFASDSEKEEKK